MTDTTENHALLIGSDMNPERVRLHPATSGGRFVGIGAASASDVAGLGLPLPDVEQVWGIVVRLAEGTQADGPVIPVVLRHGDDAVEATVLTTPGDLDDLEAVIVEAYYWELPVAYREALER